MKIHINFQLDQVGDGGDDADMPDGNNAHHVETGGSSSDAEVYADMNPTNVASKKRARSSSKAAKKARVA